MEEYEYDQVLGGYLEDQVLIENDDDDTFFENQLLMVEDLSTDFTDNSISSEERLLMYPEMRRLPPFRKLPSKETSFNIESIITEHTLLQVPDISYDISQCLGDGPKYDQEIEVVTDSPKSEIYSDSEARYAEITKKEFTKYDRSFADAILCEECRICFKSKSNFVSHQKLHIEEKPIGLIPRTRIPCAIENCDIQCDSHPTLIQHLRTHHNQQQLVYNAIEFDSIELFNEWKNDFENTTNSKYNKRWAKSFSNYNSSYYYCHRSGSLPPKESSNQRARLSKKTGRTCSAYFHVKEGIDGKVRIRGCLKHVGHDTTQIEKLPLTKSIKEEIASYLLEGLDENEIVELMKDNSAPGERRHYIQGYEIRNIYRKLEKNYKKTNFNVIVDKIKDEMPDKNPSPCSETAETPSS